MKHVIIGTAGHIDHGKTALVKALTGTDADRLKEEKIRGMTIDLGFAFMGDNSAIIDVPGHERFIKNMVAGVSAVDLALFVVAADDGVMPQTREHLDILELLGVKRGIVVITKADLVDEEWIELVKEDIRALVKGTFLEDAPMVPLSSIRGDGVDELKGLLEMYISDVEERNEKGIFRMPVDRSFSMRGFGTVVTGTVISGRASVGNNLELLPLAEVFRVRGIQAHGKDVEHASAGDRAALNFSGVEKAQIQRGDVVAEPGYFTPAFMFDCRLKLLQDFPKQKHIKFKNRTRVRVHIGTGEIMGRVFLLDKDELAPGESSLVQLRMEDATTAAAKDRFVIRRYSPALTIGGGVVIDANPEKHKRFDKGVLDCLSRLQDKDPKRVLIERVKMSSAASKPLKSLAGEMVMSPESLKAEIMRLRYSETSAPNGEIVILDDDFSLGLFHTGNWENLGGRILTALTDFHRENPVKVGIDRNSLRKMVGGIDRALFESILGGLIDQQKVKTSGALVSLSSHTIVLTPFQKMLRDQLERMILGEGYSTSGVRTWAQELGTKEDEIEEILEAMENLGIVVRIDESIVLHRDMIEKAKKDLVEYLGENKEITVSSFRGLVGTTRRYALPLLKYFDDKAVTQRSGDKRTLRVGATTTKG